MKFTNVVVVAPCSKHLPLLLVGYESALLAAGNTLVPPPLPAAFAGYPALGLSGPNFDAMSRLNTRLQKLGFAYPALVQTANTCALRQSGGRRAYRFCSWTSLQWGSPRARQSGALARLKQRSCSLRLILAPTTGELWLSLRQASATAVAATESPRDLPDAHVRLGVALPVRQRRRPKPHGGLASHHVPPQADGLTARASRRPGISLCPAPS